MKKFLKKIWRTYTGIGVMFAIPMAMSYVYSLAHIVMGMGAASGSKWFFTLLLAFGWCVFAPLARGFLWLPSLVIWVNSGADNFWRWLAPGFFERGGLSWHL